MNNGTEYLCERDVNKMDFLIYKAVKETVDFLELCQNQAFSNRISIDVYMSLTCMKFNFIKNVLENEGRTVFIDKVLRKRINLLFKNDYYLYDSSKDIVGE